MTRYYRPIPIQSSAPALYPGALPLAGGWARFDQVEEITRAGDGIASRLLPVAALPSDVRLRLTAPRQAIAGMSWEAPRLMAVLNVTPDSFSDGGDFAAPEMAAQAARDLMHDGADILDIGGESTRPGAKEVPVDEEIARVLPAVTAAKAAGALISIDTRKAAVGAAALKAGAAILNDVSAMVFDPAMAALAAKTGAPICLMHAQGDPETMQADPRYAHVLLDVYDFLARRIAVAEAAGIARERIIVDPGIGFGKTQAHNLTLLRGLTLFHGLGCPLLLGASRKRFIGAIAGVAEAKARGPGSIAVALAAVTQGVQILRVHDIAETKQALALHMALATDKASLG
ncbi:MAG: dihydropteroate synthase [Pseudomonadota bacterium]